jgi:hypothetical protein
MGARSVSASATQRENSIVGLLLLTEIISRVDLWISAEYVSCLFGLLRPLAFAQPNTGAATVLVNEFDPCGSKGFFNLLKRSRVAGVSTDFNVIDCIPMKARCLGQVPNGPV